MRANSKIEGLRILTLESKISVYADDINFRIQPNITTFIALVDELNDFSNISGLKPNYEKCTVLRIGSLRGSNFEFCCDLPS